MFNSMSRVAAAVLSAALAACGGSGPEVYHDVNGVVRDVNREYEQLLIEHEDIPGLMPAMTMNFDVADPALLDAAEKGDAVVFELEHDEKGYRIRALQSLGPAPKGGDQGAWLPMDRAASLDVAPPFELVDQAGSSVSLESLRGKAVVLDFIFANCPGPCPILTGILRDVQQALAPEMRARSHFVSISLDPVRDTPAALSEYARRRDLDTSDWSFLTGDPDLVAAVLEAYGVSAKRQPDGNINHLVAVFLIDPEGRVAERYIGLETGPDEIRADLERLLA